MSRRTSAKDLIPASPSEEDYATHPVEEEVDADAVDPIALFLGWLGEASAKEPSDANAMTLATVDSGGLPDARTVLLKDADAQGFVFYTNLQSAKGRELAANPKAALLFHWKSLRRQVRVRGPVEPVSDQEADAYFATRARASQIGAWASQQSRPLESRLALETAVAQIGMKHALGAVPRPPFWSGFRVVPLAIEFWRARRFRLHERRLFTRPGPDQPWTITRLYP